MVDIRPITEADIADLNHIVGVVARERRYLRFIDAPSMASTVDFITTSLAAGNPHFAAVTAGKVVGWCDVCLHGFDIERHGGTLGIGLLPDHRGRGIGLALITATIAAADARGFERIDLTAFADNIRAMALYERVGFRREGVMRAAARFGVDDYRDMVLMARLTPAIAAR